MARRRHCFGLLVLAFALSVSGAGTAASDDPVNSSRYLTMRDGVKIAIELWLPRSRSGRIPTLLRATRYWRAIGFVDPKRPDSNLPEAQALTGGGYAVVVVDVRGSGASFGSWATPWSREEIKDLGEVVDWIVAQPWSNGRVGAYGTSYDANTAEFLASLGRPAVKAVLPNHADFDPFRGNAFPGGVFSDWFVGIWNTTNHGLDRNDICGAQLATGAQCRELKKLATGVKPVAGDAGGRLLRAAIAQHGANIDVYRIGRKVVFLDDRFGVTPIAVWSPYTYLPRLEKAGVAVQAVASWMDAGTADGALSRFMSASSPQQVLIGGWNHGANSDSDPFRARDAPLIPKLGELDRLGFAFLGAYLKPRVAPPKPIHEIRYYTLGEGKFRTTKTWPPAGLKIERWYFQVGGGLARFKPRVQSGADRYRIDPSATTGAQNRWHAQAGGDIVYPDRTLEDRKLLTYTSAPLRDDLEITGHPVVTLEVTSTAKDGTFIVYLEDVAPNGRVTYIDEGELRAIHRKISNARPPYPTFGPYHSFLRRDAEPLLPGRLAELNFALLPTSVLLHKGHRIRIAVAGADSGTFARIPATDTPLITVARNRVHPSGIELPVRPR